MKNMRLVIILAALAGGAILGALGQPDRRVSLASVIDLWTDAVRDADQIPMQATRSSDAEEMQLGDDIAKEVLAVNQEDPALSIYVTGVAAKLLPKVDRPGIRYKFHVIESPAINAFAIPGGHVFVNRGLIDFVDSEAQLAAVLGHEISHVDYRHCIERYQYEVKMKKLGVPEAGWVLAFARQVVTLGFSPKQELDADAHGEMLATQAGYNPNAAATLFWKMQKAFNEAPRSSPNTPDAEAVSTVAGGLTDFFRSHPPSQDRAEAMNNIVTHNNTRLTGRRFYDGVKNLHQRLPWSQKEFPDEFRQF